MRIRNAELLWERDNRLRVTVYWEAVRTVSSDYRVAVHLVSRDPPQGAEDVLAQSDTFNPVDGWYPVNLWDVGEVVRDDHVLSVPPNTSPTAVRIAMYQIG